MNVLSLCHRISLVCAQSDGAEGSSAQEALLQSVPALRLLENHAAVLENVVQYTSRRPELPPVEDPQLPDLRPAAADVICILHLVSEVRGGGGGEGRGGEGEERGGGGEGKGGGGEGRGGGGEGRRRGEGRGRRGEGRRRRGKGKWRRGEGREEGVGKEGDRMWEHLVVLKYFLSWGHVLFLLVIAGA